jgi:dTDP-4-dehydrorhamnose 3,5-epimerase
MKILSRPLDALILLQTDVHRDERGFFMEAFRREWLAEMGLEAEFVQDNVSRSAPRVLRGLHYQIDPAQGKLVSVRRGKIWDASVDLRKNSPTFGQFFCTELEEADGKLLWIPPGFAHGFCVLGQGVADVSYKTTGYYNPRSEKGLRWNDPQINIPWPISNPILSAKDAVLPGIETAQQVF